VSGLLNVRGVLGGSASAPTGLLRVKLLDGALGRQRLARSTASLALNSRQQLTMDVELAPADSHGFVKLAGSIDLLGQQQTEGQGQEGLGQTGGDAAAGGVQALTASGADGKGGEGQQGNTGSSAGSNGGSKGRKKKGKGQQQQPAAAAAVAPAPAAPADSSSSSSSEPFLELGLSVRDGGMSLLTSLAPGLTWGGGSAALNFAATGPASAPILTGVSGVFTVDAAQHFAQAASVHMCPCCLAVSLLCRHKNAPPVPYLALIRCCCCGSFPCLQAVPASTRAAWAPACCATPSQHSVAAWQLTGTAWQSVG
jgi:hypothetical protein